MPFDFDGKHPEILYPCDWTYQLIVQDEGAVRTLVAELAGSDPHTLELSRESTGGRYHSLRFVLRVRDEEHRLSVFEALRSHAGVRFVL